MSLKEKKLKPQEVIFGIHPIVELLKARRRKLYAIYTTKPVPKAWGQIEKILPKEVAVQFVPREALNRMAGTTDHQSVVGFASPLVIRSKFFDPQKSPFLVMLDRIQDPRNLGAIIRSSYCTAADGIILTGKSSAPLNAIALKSSAGLAEHIDFYQAPTAALAIQELRKVGYHCYAATLNGSDATGENFKMPLCLIIGNEAEGIASNILSFCKEIRLPQKSADISYNASVAAGILLFLISHSKNKI